MERKKARSCYEGLARSPPWQYFPARGLLIFDTASIDSLQIQNLLHHPFERSHIKGWAQGMGKKSQANSELMLHKPWSRISNHGKVREGHTLILQIRERCSALNCACHCVGTNVCVWQIAPSGCHEQTLSAGAHIDPRLTLWRHALVAWALTP
jgi:hypothetical protein